MNDALEHHIELLRLGEESSRLINPLLADVDSLIRMLEVEDSQTIRRSFARSLFALVDGKVFTLKQDVLRLSKFDGWDLDQSDVEKLIETRQTKTLGKDSARRPLFLPTIQNLLYAIDSYNLLHHAHFEISQSSEGWKSFSQAATIRNRITHPKSWRSLIISDADLEVLKTAESWFRKTMANLHRACHRALMRRLRSLERHRRERGEPIPRQLHLALYPEPARRRPQPKSCA